jgi:hypothetical protein
MLVHGLKLCLQRVHSAVWHPRSSCPGEHIRTGLASSHVPRKKSVLMKLYVQFLFKNNEWFGTVTKTVPGLDNF